MQCAYSVASARRNLRRAGTSSNNCRTSMVVPIEPEAGVGALVDAWICQAWGASALREVSVSRATDAIEARASPRKPIEATDSSSLSEAILLVACRVRARVSSSCGIPEPSSLTEILRMPPPSRRTSIARAPASMAFSSNSFRTDAGRSITSPAAIWLTSKSGSGIIRRLDDIGRLALCVFRVEQYTFNGFQTVAAYFNRLLYGVGLASIGLAGLLFWCGTMPDLL